MPIAYDVSFKKASPPEEWKEGFKIGFSESLKIRNFKSFHEKAREVQAKMSSCYELEGTMVENGPNKLVRECDIMAGEDILQNT